MNCVNVLMPCVEAFYGSWLRVLQPMQFPVIMQALLNPEQPRGTQC